MTTERKKVTLDDLIKRKMTLKDNVDRKSSGTLFIPSLGGDIDYEVFKSDVMDMKQVISQLTNSEEDLKIAEQEANNLIYTMVKNPNLRDKTLQEEFECVEPTDIVDILFTEGEKEDLVNIALDGTGFRTGVIEEIKN